MARAGSTTITIKMSPTLAHVIRLNRLFQQAMELIPEWNQAELAEIKREYKKELRQLTALHIYL